MFFFIPPEKKKQFCSYYFLPTANIRTWDMHATLMNIIIIIERDGCVTGAFNVSERQRCSTMGTIQVQVVGESEVVVSRSRTRASGRDEI